MIKWNPIYQSASFHFILKISHQNKFNKIFFFLEFRTILIDWYQEAVFSTTQQGRLKLIHRGFQYTTANKNNGVTYWVCSKKRCECRGKARTMQINGKQMVKTYDLHNHNPVDTEMEC